ncbi:hypothetical protein EG834_18850, partial [bacterium]|nr:hypothetical protein [bacterium]
MKEHTDFEELLPFYAAGGCTPLQKREMEAHLNGCHECQNELLMWKAVSNEIESSNATVALPVGIPAQALRKIHTPNPLA